MSETVDQFVHAITEHAPNFNLRLSETVLVDLGNYYEILMNWNARLHLVAPCTPKEFAIRHVLESLLAINYFKSNSKVVDVGSGGGLPIIPCMIARPDIRGTLIESSPKKAVFLREALRVTNTSERSNVVTSRFEETPSPDANVVTCRALERFRSLLPTMVEWAPFNSTLILFGGPSLQVELENNNLIFEMKKIPESDQRFIFKIQKNELKENS